MELPARLPAGLDQALSTLEQELGRHGARLAYRLRVLWAWLSRRLWRAGEEAWRRLHIAAWEAGVHARAAGAGAGALLVELGQALRRPPEQTPRGCDDAASFPLALFLMLLIVLPTLFAASVDAKLGPVREQAAVARTVRPSPCVWTDGQVWIENGGEFIRPRDRQYDELRHRLCGF